MTVSTATGIVIKNKKKETPNGLKKKEKDRTMKKKMKIRKLDGKMNWNLYCFSVIKKKKKKKKEAERISEELRSKREKKWENEEKGKVTKIKKGLVRRNECKLKENSLK